MTAVTVSLEGTLEVCQTQRLNDLVRLVRLASPDGAVLPSWSPGSHILVQVTLADGSKDWRHYSLIDLEGTRGQPRSGPASYTIAVRREEDGRGGSRFMHEALEEGDSLEVQGPINNFPLNSCNGSTLLLAGGIGITPLVSMVSHCRANDRVVALYYAGRSRSVMAFTDDLAELLGSDLHVHADDEHDGAFYDVSEVLDRCGPDDRLYVCGPKPMLDNVLAATEERQWEAGRVSFEVFTEPATDDQDHAFEVELAQSGESFVVPADQTLLDCLIEHGHDPIYDCTRGECGVCTTDVIEGEIDHRDYVLTQAEKDSGEVMQICVSRAKGDKIVLDM